MILRLPRAEAVRRVARPDGHGAGCSGVLHLHIERERPGWRIVKRCGCRLVFERGAQLFATLKDAEAILRAIER